jgi:hypothetical protein
VENKTANMQAKQLQQCIPLILKASSLWLNFWNIIITLAGDGPVFASTHLAPVTLGLMPL